LGALRRPVLTLTLGNVSADVAALLASLA